MYNNKPILILVISVLLLLLSCIKEEALNKEADILAIEVGEINLERPPIITNDRIQCDVGSDANLRSLSPVFVLTKGATIFPPGGTTMNFQKPRVYTVYSEDGEWFKRYTITFAKPTIFTKYTFDSYRVKDGSYYEFYEQTSSEQSLNWASGNAGLKILLGANKDEYPTVLEKEGYNNTAVKLITRSTGTLGAMNGSPIAAGNVFTGYFKLNMQEPLKSTHFGVSFMLEPLKLSGFYKYKSGDQYIQHTNENGIFNNEGKILNRQDSCTMYAVFYECDDETNDLDGTNILTHPNIVSIAMLEGKNEAANWTHFEMPFVLQNGKKVDVEKLKAGKYNLAIVFSSSKEGDKYNGAIGSTLIVDEVELKVDN